MSTSYHAYVIFNPQLGKFWRDEDMLWDERKFATLYSEKEREESSIGPDAVWLECHAFAYRCPECGCGNKLQFEISVWTAVELADIHENVKKYIATPHVDEDRPLDWNHDNRARCRECGYQGIVKDFTIEATSKDIGN